MSSPTVPAQRHLRIELKGLLGPAQPLVEGGREVGVLRVVLHEGVELRELLFVHLRTELGQFTRPLLLSVVQRRVRLVAEVVRVAAVGLAERPAHRAVDLRGVRDQTGDPVGQCLRRVALLLRPLVGVTPDMREEPPDRPAADVLDLDPQRGGVHVDSGLHAPLNLEEFRMSVGEEFPDALGLRVGVGELLRRLRDEALGHGRVGPAPPGPVRLREQAGFGVSRERLETGDSLPPVRDGCSELAEVYLGHIHEGETGHRCLPYLKYSLSRDTGRAEPSRPRIDASMASSSLAYDALE